MPNVDGDLKDAPRPKSSDIAAEASQTPRSPTDSRIECAHSMLPDVEAKCDPRRDGVRQVEEGCCGYDADEVDVCGDSSGDNEGNAPPNRNDGGVKDLASFGRNKRGPEDVYQNVVVEYFDAYIAVQRCGNETT